MPGPGDHEAVLRWKARIEKLLLAELEAARAEFDAVKERYRKSIELAKGTDTLGIEQRAALLAIVKEQGRVLSRYSAALAEFNDFAIRGLIPERFRGETR